nr:hypothetical protein [uncultured Pedobacter sp.]
MKVAIATGFLAKRNMDINAGHLAKIRYKNDLCTEENVCIQEYRDYKELIRLAKVITN